MRIAVPISLTDPNAPTLAEEFSRAADFAIYDIDDDSRAVSYCGRQSVETPGCEHSAAFLKTHGVEVVMVHGISDNGVNHLLESGILAIKDAPILSSDALVAHLVSGTLQATPPDAAMHHAGESSCGHGGCSHCSGGHQH
jgi:predicted Fe-Mo cluster-binding NifX family protein